MRARTSSGRLLRWCLLLVAPLLAGLGHDLTSASPQQVPTCTWERLDSGEDRAQHAMGYLPTDMSVVMFGGADLRQGSGSQIKDDVHRLPMAAGATRQWTQINFTGPEDRMEHAVAVRTVPGSGDELFTFGGIDRLPTGGGGTFTWSSPLGGAGVPPLSLEGIHAPARVINAAHKIAFTGAQPQWSSVGPAGQQRTDHSMIWVPSDDALVVFGGRRTEEASSAEDSTWQLKLGTSPAWQPINAQNAPSKRFAHSAVYDPTSVRMLVFGGTSDWNNAFNDVYALNLLEGTSAATWERLQPTGSPPRGRYDHAAAYIPALEWMVVYGGLADVNNQLSDTYALDLRTNPPAWIRLSPQGAAPPALSGLAGTYAMVDNLVVLQGGQVGADARDQTWGLRCGSVDPTPTHTSTDVPATGTATATLETVETPTEQATTPTTPETETTPTQTQPSVTETPTAPGPTPEPEFLVWLPTARNRQ